MSSANFTIGTVTDRGLNPRRTANEDRLLVLPDSSFFLVADGVGGHRGGQVASQTAVDVFTKAFTNPPTYDLAGFVNQTIAQANAEIFRTSQAVAELNGMASTLALVVVEGQRAIIAHVGDSRVYRFDGKNLVCETEDHSEVNDAVRAGKLSVAEAENHPHRNIISRALGADAEVEPELKIIPIDNRTSFLLCSDGITRHISDAEMTMLLLRGQHPENICAELKELCFARGAEDNLTAVIIDCGPRTYAEQATRPTIGKTAFVAPTAVAANNSRISVDFSGAPATPQTPARAAQAKAPSRKRSYVAGIIQLGLLIGFFIGIFYVGRNWEKVKSIVSGNPITPPAMTNEPAPSPTITNADFGAAKALFEERRFDKARDSFAKLVEQDKTNAEYQYWLGRSFLELKNYPDAIKNLNEAAKLNDKLPNVFGHLSLAYSAIGDRKNAEEYLRRSVSTSSSPSASISPTPAG